MNKKILLDGNLKRYKANLHCHTTVSDGRLSPEEVKEAYKAKGYSVVAYTDHDVFLAHDYLNDKDFLALHGYEMEFPHSVIKRDLSHPTCHICLIQRDPDNMVQVCWNEKNKEEYVHIGNAGNYIDKLVVDRSQPDFERVFSPEVISKAMQIGRENGFFVTYNHPTWSMEDYKDYMNYHGMHAMEICNYGCYIDGYEEYNARVYDDMLRGGERIFCIGADDNHNFTPLSSPTSDSFGAYTVILAEDLSYKSIMDALFAGNFYASQGPEIHSVYCQDGRVHITCSPAASIYMSTNGRIVQHRQSTVDDLTQADFWLPKDSQYFRITVRDSKGNHANTNAYFLDEVNKQEEL